MVKKFIKKIANSGLQTKVILFTIIVTVLPFVIIISILLNSLLKTSVDVEQKALDQTTFLVEQDLLNNIGAKAKIYDLTLKDMMIHLEDIKNRIIEEGFSDKLLNNFYNQNRIVSSVYFINSSSILASAPDSGNNHSGEKINLAEIKEFDFLKSESVNKYTGHWLGPYTDFKSQLKIVTYAIPIWQNNKFQGLIGFDLVVSNLFTEIINFDPSQSSYVFIVKNNGDLISPTDKIYADFQIPKTSTNILDSPATKNQEMSDVFLSTTKKEGISNVESGSAESQKIMAFSSIPSFSGKIFVISPINEIVQIQKEKAREIQQTVGQARTAGFVYVFIATFFVVLISYYLARTIIINPIIRLKTSMENFENTGAVSQINIARNDEIGKLTESFNSMETKLKESRLKLEEYSKNLEKQITDRTEELKSKVDQLEKFNKIAVDRELKMIKLKKEIEELKKKSTRS